MPGDSPELRLERWFCRNRGSAQSMQKYGKKTDVFLVEDDFVIIHMRLDEQFLQLVKNSQLRKRREEKFFQFFNDRHAETTAVFHRNREKILIILTW